MLSLFNDQEYATFSIIYIYKKVKEPLQKLKNIDDKWLHTEPHGGLYEASGQGKHNLQIL